MTTATRTPETIERVIGRISEISTLPTVAMKIMETVQDPRSSAKDLMRVVGSDPALTTRLLRAVNSAAYGLRVKITNLQHAIACLGFTQVRNLALTASVSSVFRGGDRVGNYSRLDLWRHMVSVAIGARLLSRRLGMPNFEDAFLAGLLHDIGLILLDQHAHAHFAEMIAAATASRQPLCQVERETYGFDHALLGEMMAENWKLPVTLRAAIGQHHRSHNYKGEGAAIVQCVETANVICSLKGMPSVGVNLVQPNLSVFQALGLSQADIKVYAQDLDQAIAQHESLFDLL